MKKIKQQAIEHYERMIKWAEKQNSSHLAIASTMRLSINENWFGGFCGYCNNKPRKVTARLTDKCVGCELGRSVFTCCDDLWETMNSSMTWKEWITNAKKVLEYIKENG